MNTARPLTLKQYVTQVQDDARAEYGITVAEAQEFYPEHVLLPQWVQTLIDHAAAGGEFDPPMVRTLTEEQRYAVSKFGYSNSRYLLEDGRTVS